MPYLFTGRSMGDLGQLFLQVAPFVAAAGFVSGKARKAKKRAKKALQALLWALQLLAQAQWETEQEIRRADKLTKQAEMVSAIAAERGVTLLTHSQWLRKKAPTPAIIPPTVATEKKTLEAAREAAAAAAPVAAPVVAPAPVEAPVITPVAPATIQTAVKRISVMGRLRR